MGRKVENKTHYFIKKHLFLEIAEVSKNNGYGYIVSYGNFQDYYYSTKGNAIRSLTNQLYKEVTKEEFEEVIKC